MEAATESPRINVLINLSSKLLSEGLHRLMENCPTKYRAFLAHDPGSVHGFIPHKILFDAATLEHSAPALWNGAKIILIDTGLSEDEVIRLLFQHQLDGVISTDTDSKLFWKALEIIGSGQIWIDNSKLRSLLHAPVPDGNTPTQKSFSRREREIVLLVAEGRTNRDIATHLIISEQTVKSHLSRIFRKADVTSRNQLAPLALKFKMDASARHA